MVSVCVCGGWREGASGPGPNRRDEELGTGSGKGREGRGTITS